MKTFTTIAMALAVRIKGPFNRLQCTLRTVGCKIVSGQWSVVTWELFAHLTGCSKVEKLSSARIKQATASLLFPVHVHIAFNKIKFKLVPMIHDTQLHDIFKLKTYMSCTQQKFLSQIILCNLSVAPCSVYGHVEQAPHSDKPRGWKSNEQLCWKIAFATKLTKVVS